VGLVGRGVLGGSLAASCSMPVQFRHWQIIGWTRWRGSLWEGGDEGLKQGSGWCCLETGGPRIYVGYEEAKSTLATVSGL